MRIALKDDINSLKKINLLRLVNDGEVSLKEEKPKPLDEVEDYFSQKYGF